MEKSKEIVTQEKKSNLTLESRKKLLLTGVDEVVNFNDRLIVLNTCMGGLNIKGEGLKMTKLDVHNGEIIIIGKINSFVYVNAENVKDTESVFSKLFK